MNNLCNRVMCRKFLLGILLLVLPSLIQAQTTRTVGGLVTSDKGELLIGVNVRIKGSNTGVTTGENGRYQLAVPNNQSILVFSFIGFAEQEIAVGTRSTIDVKLSSSAKDL